LKQSIDDWREFYLNARNSLVERAVPPLPTRKLAAALVGVRRAGKTSQAILMTRSVPAEKVLYYNFEDPLFYTDDRVDNLDLLVSVASEFSPAPLEVLILDEIQNVDGWWRWIRKIVDQGRYRVIVTGSSAKLLSAEIATVIAGRCLQYRVWPLSFSELLAFRGGEARTRHHLLSALRDMMTWGSYPEVILTEDEGARKRLLKQYLNDIVLKDVLGRFEIRNTRALDQILTYYLTNPSSLHSYSALRKAFGVNTDTAGSYTRALADAFVVFEVNRYHANLKVQARDPKKVYIIDPGLRAVGARSTSDDTGKLLENLVFIELLRREKEVSYYKGEREVDFVVTESYQPREAIQVCASDLADEKTHDREVGGLLECLDSLGLARGTIVTHDREERIRRGGKRIDFVPAWTWLRPT
jgi:hypothetical protein